MDCIPGQSEKDKPVGYLETEGAHASLSSGPTVNPPATKLSWGMLFWLIFTTKIAIAGLILGAWATWKARSISIPVPYASVYTSAGQIPSGMQAFNLGTGTGYWTAEKNMLNSRSDHGAEASGDMVYLFGGLASDTFGNATVLSSTASYNTYTGVLKELAPMPEPRYRMAHAIIGGKIYVTGGITTYDSTSPSVTAYVYDISANTWAVLPNITTPRNDPASAALNGKFYVIGGYSTDYAEKFATGEVFDPATNAWSALPANLNIPRGDARAAVAGGQLFVVGGVAGDNYDFIASVEAWDERNRRWVPKANMSYARGDFALAALQSGRLLASGGETKVGADSQFAQHAVEEYNPVEDAWVTKAPLPQAMFRSAGAAVKDRFYVFGGQPTCGIDTVNASCHSLALPTVLGFFDEIFPALYVGTPATTPRRRLAARRMGA